MRNYEAMMSQMNPEKMAELGVKLVTVNNRDLYYMTSTGQLYLTSQYEEAVRHEYNWLLHDPEPKAPDSDKSNDKPTTDPSTNKDKQVNKNE